MDTYKEKAMKHSRTQWDPNDLKWEPKPYNEYSYTEKAPRPEIASVREDIARDLLRACANFKSELGCFPNLAGCTHREDAAIVLGITLDELKDQLSSGGISRIRCRWNVDKDVDKHSPDNWKKLSSKLEEIQEHHRKEITALRKSIKQKSVSTKKT